MTRGVFEIHARCWGVQRQLKDFTECPTFWARKKFLKILQNKCPKLNALKILNWRGIWYNSSAYSFINLTVIQKYVGSFCVCY